MKLVSLIAATVVLAAGPTAQDSGHPKWRGTSSEIHGKVKDKIVGSSWREGCPVGLKKLRLLRLRHWGFDGEVHKGRLVVHRGHDREVLHVFRRLFRKRFPIRRMKLIDAYGADDHRSMNADNTSGFNCRFVAGTTRWSMHAYGKAIDINPVENPYVWSGGVSPPQGAGYVDRTQDRKGMIHHRDAVWWAFRYRGWEWGGDWTDVKDYQHFSQNGR